MVKRVLAFGYGYDPEQLRGGVHLTDCFADPDQGSQTIICEFTPHISPRILKTLGELMSYDTTKVGYGWLKKDEPDGTRKFLTFAGLLKTNGNAKTVVDDINEGITQLFDRYESTPFR